MIPTREPYPRSGQTYFVSSQTACRRPFFRNERWALLLKEVLLHYRGASYQLHAYVIMPDHFHLLLSPEKSLERSIQNIKGGFSFRASRAFVWNDEIWQKSFTDHRIRDKEDWGRYLAYIKQNPVKASLCPSWLDYPYLGVELDPIPQRLKPVSCSTLDGTAEAVPLQTQQLKRL
jgi:putative transposase